MPTKRIRTISNGYLYQNVINNGGGIPIVPSSSKSDSLTLNTGASYNFTNYLWGQAQLTYYDQSYFGNTYNGSFFSGTLGYGKRIFDTFTVSASIIESTNKFANNSLGFIGNLNGFRHIGEWELSGAFSYAQNVQSYLVTYTTSYYNYSANLHRRLGHGMQFTAAYNGNHTGFSQNAGTLSESNGFSTSVALRRFQLTGNYVKYSGQSILTTNGIQPITQPGLPLPGLIVYNGQSYGAGIGINPIPRLTISGNYAHATSDTLSATAPSNNHTEIVYAQMQYRLRQITMLAGYEKFTQGISASGLTAASDYSYFVGVTRYFNFF